jgi:hypothetical protein
MPPNTVSPIVDRSHTLPPPERRTDDGGITEPARAATFGAPAIPGQDQPSTIKSRLLGFAKRKSEANIAKKKREQELIANAQESFKDQLVANGMDSVQAKALSIKKIFNAGQAQDHFDIREARDIVMKEGLARNLSEPDARKNAEDEIVIGKQARKKLDEHRKNNERIAQLIDDARNAKIARFRDATSHRQAERIAYQSITTEEQALDYLNDLKKINDDSVIDDARSKYVGELVGQGKDKDEAGRLAQDEIDSVEYARKYLATISISNAKKGTAEVLKEKGWNPKVADLYVKTALRLRVIGLSPEEICEKLGEAAADKPKSKTFFRKKWKPNAEYLEEQQRKKDAAARLREQMTSALSDFSDGLQDIEEEDDQETAAAVSHPPAGRKSRMSVRQSIQSMPLGDLTALIQSIGTEQ